MRNILFITILLFSLSCNNSNTSNTPTATAIVASPYSANGTDTALSNQLPTLDFTDTLHNFGTINEGEKVAYDFNFKNNGKTPLIISSATGSCGCTVADYQHEPVQPGKSGVIKVNFDATAKQGHQEKAVSIIANTLKNLHLLHITAEIAPKK